MKVKIMRTESYTFPFVDLYRSVKWWAVSTCDCTVSTSQ